MTTFKPNPFYNRIAELAALDRASSMRAPAGQLLLLYGRRRLGKTYLLQYFFGKGEEGKESLRPHCYYLAEQATATLQRAALAQQLLTALPTEGVTIAEIAVSWNSLLRFVAERARAQQQVGRFALILDELPYLIEQTPELPSILQAWWDREGIHSPLFVILCGSQLSTMSALGRENAPLFGRFNAGNFRLEPLSFMDVAAFYQGASNYGVVEKLLMYGILGGTPRYHAMVDTSQPIREEVVTLLMQPHAILENEVRYLLGSEQIRDPAPYNSVLEAIASGETQFGRIQQAVGAERGTLSFYLRTLQELEWIRKELPFGETSERRALYRVADPFLAFWYRFVAPLASELTFTNPKTVFDRRVAPYLANYMGRYVFEDMCLQWLQKNAQARFGVGIRQAARYWSRDSLTEVDIIAALNDGNFLFAECKWRAESELRIGDFVNLKAKVMTLPKQEWKREPYYLLMTVGEIAPELSKLAEDLGERLLLVNGRSLFT